MILTALSFLFSFLLELFELLLIILFNLHFHLRKLDLILVLGLSDFVLKCGAVVLPFKSLEVVDSVFSTDVVVRVHIFCDLRESNLTSFEFKIGLLTKLVVRRLHLLDSLIRDLFVLLLKVQEFISQNQQLAHFTSVFNRQLLNHFLLVFDLLFELFKQAVVLGAHPVNFLVFLSD